MDSVPVDSVPVIPWPFRNPPEFRGTEITILAGSTAKIPFRGIPGITRIPADSGRNTWGTVKNSNPTSLFRMDVVTRYDKSHLDEDGQSSCALVLTG